MCGVPPSVHGVSGNYYLDREADEEIMMIDATSMRAPPSVGVFASRRARRRHHRQGQAAQGTWPRIIDGHRVLGREGRHLLAGEHGIADVVALVGEGVPDQYSAELSLFVLDAGVRLLDRDRPELMYLSLSDYVQHKHAPQAPEALAFMQAVDRRIGAARRLGATVALTADHGMNDMADAAGMPNVLYLGDRLDARYGAGVTRVICPITDPFVRHHGALGGFVRVHLLQGGADADEVAGFVRALDGVALALTRDEACRRFELPPDREGDIAVVAQKGVAIGARATEHDLSQLAGERLRSHGGTAEQTVPLLFNRPLSDVDPARRLRNFDVFDLALNHAA